MGVEAGVLHGHEGLLEVDGHGLDGHHDAVLDALVLGDEVAVGVVDEGGLRLVIQGGEVQGRGGFHIALGDADHRAHQREAAHQHQHKQDPHRVHQHGKDEIGLLYTRLEDRMRIDLLLREEKIRLLLPGVIGENGAFRGPVLIFKQLRIPLSTALTILFQHKTLQSGIMVYSIRIIIARNARADNRIHQTCGGYSPI